jgi:hypothetical protein
MARKPVKTKGEKLARTLTLYQSPIVSNDEEILDYNKVPKAQRLNNCYVEWLNPETTKTESQVAKEYRVGKLSL